MKKLKTLFSVIFALCSLTLQAQTLVYTNDFESGPPFAGWDTEYFDHNPRTGKYIGHFTYNEVGNQQMILSLDSMPDHQFVTVEFDMLTFNTWDGSGRNYNDLPNQSPLYNDPGCPDIFKVSSEGMTLVHTTFASHDLEFYRYQSYPGTYPQDQYRAGTGAVETNTLGTHWNLNWYKNRVPDAITIENAVYHFKLTYPSTNSFTDIVFQTFNTDSTFNNSTWINDTDEYWGIDNISVTVSDQPISPVTLAVPANTTQIVANKTSTAAVIYTWGEAGTFLQLQSATNPTQGTSINNGADGGFVNLNNVSFNGYYKYNTSFRTTAGLQSVDTESPRPAPIAKFFRAKITK
jgi:hypothetical protein